MFGKKKVDTVGLLTQEQWDTVHLLNKKGVKFDLKITFTDGIPTERHIYVQDSKKHRTVLLKAARIGRLLRKDVRTIKKEMAYDKSITGSTDIDGMTMQFYNWDQCKVIGHRKVMRRKLIPVPILPAQYEEVEELIPVTDCQIREGQVSEAELVLVDEPVTAQPESPF